MNSLPLPGCAPMPLAHYLKALGMLRLISVNEQDGDTQAVGHWERDAFVLHSKFDREGLIQFFLRHYSPTPILAPWNGGSGFHRKDNTEAITAIDKSTGERFLHFREAISSARAALKSIGLKEKPSPDEKERLLRHCRNTFPDGALNWLDAAFVLTDDGAKYPPLLGTGGNDGRLEFTNNFMQRLIEIISPETGAPTAQAKGWLESSLFGSAVAVPTSKAPVGQFLPGAAGGANTTSGFGSESAVNPWDFVLMLEGALLFAAAAVRRLEGTEPGALAYPFCVRQAAVGYGSASPADEENSRAEMWLPLWSKPVGLVELTTVLSEGRAQLGQRAARNGVDFARAVVTLGVDRGISAFQRFGFQVRNGLSYFATPLDRVVVRRNASADLLSEIDPWLARLRDKAGPSAKQVPASVSRALSQLENRILDLCKDGRASRLQAVLVALGQAERALARSLAWTTGRNDQIPVTKCQPLVGLSGRWLRDADDRKVEFRLAASLASITGFPYKDNDGKSVPLHFRQHLERVAVNGGAGHYWFTWDEQARDVVWNDGDFVDVLNRIFSRRLIRAEQSGLDELPDNGIPALLDDVIAFIEGETDDDLLADLVWALSLLNWSEKPKVSWAGETKSQAIAYALFNLLRLAFPRGNERKLADLPEVPPVLAIHRHAAAGNGREASRLASRRLRVSDMPPSVTEVALLGDTVRRSAAALLFPLHHSDVAHLKELVCKTTTQTI
ncbi:MAG TPA: type I-U CRISPR-associated protein Csx17 [Candidatus Angelobacter sp.]|nr:type I-U CRISPR-associated protein Csx17 [Candidatus Angelobacter sp.]